MLFCYNCGVVLSEKNFCTSCGASVGRYKKIIYMSNRYYNRGLDKAQIRDLTSAAEDLRQSLKLYKRNTQARNLLGLVYFEMGETVAAMSEWVLSQHYQPEKNLANDYIAILSANAVLLDNMNSSIKKYNQALTLCRQDSLDVAKISLKRVIGNNPKLINARLLLALIMMKEEDYNGAKKELVQVRKIDRGNVTAALYMKMADENLHTDASRKKKKSEVSTTYQSGNDIIIQPKERKDNFWLNVFINAMIGLVVGLLVGWFLLGPIRVNMEKADVNTELESLRQTSDKAQSDIDGYKQDIDSLTAKLDTANYRLKEYENEDGILTGYTYLLKAVEEINKGQQMDQTLVKAYMDKVDSVNSDRLMEDEEFTRVYEMVKEKVGPSVSQSAYEQGYQAYKIESYNDAIEYFLEAIKYNPDNIEALYYLGCSYAEGKSDTENAMIYFKMVIEKAPDTEIAVKAQNYLASLDKG